MTDTLPPGTLVPGRSCGACSMCCKLPGIAELDKPPMAWCRHAVPGRGCSIHPDRPGVCRTFFCHYLRNPNLGPEWRPERSGFMLYTEAGGKRLVVASDSAKPGAWRRPPYYAQFKRWAAQGAPHQHQLLVFNGKRATAVLPDRDEDLGLIEIGDVVAYHVEPGGIRVEVRRQALA